MTSRPELIKARRDNNTGNGKKINGLDYLSFPTKPMPHGLLLQFKDYNYNKYVNTITAPPKADENGGETGTFAFNSAAYKFVNDINPPEIEAAAAIELPFPRQLADNTNIRVQQFERDFIYERMASAAASMSDAGLSSVTTGVQNFLAAVRQGGSDLINNREALLEQATAAAKNVTGGSAQKAAALAGYLARNYISGEIGKNLGVVGERVINPQETLSFSGVDLRNFTFTWDLFPSNKNDTESLNKIINLLKVKSLPAVDGIDGSVSLSRAFLKYPSVVELNLLGVQENHFMRFKRCMISSVNIDYGGQSGMPEIIKGGVPASVTLSIGFSELQIHTQDDYLPKADKSEGLGGSSF